jgi:hypothetical protein
MPHALLLVTIVLTLLYCPRFPPICALPLPRANNVGLGLINLCWPVAGDGESPAHRNKPA